MKKTMDFTIYLEKIAHMSQDMHAGDWMKKSVQTLHVKATWW